MLGENRASFVSLLLRVCERRDMTTEGILGYDLGHYMLITQQNVDQHCFHAGDVFEVRIGDECPTGCAPMCLLVKCSGGGEP